MRGTKMLILIVIQLICFSSCQPKVMTETTMAKPMEIVPVKPQAIVKNIIFLVGDGMGLGQLSAGTYANGNQSALEAFSVIGLHKPYAQNKLITDSAAAATAFACGKKTYNGAIAVDKDKRSIPTLLEEAEEKGLATGLVASSSIVHATPACYIAHNEYRKNYEEIAADFLDTEIDYFVGGGLKYFQRREKDDRDLTKELQARGYTISDYFQADFKSVVPDSKTNFGYFTADEEPIPVSMGRDYLVDAASKSFPFLKERSNSGFFIMIEGSQIDWGGHANDTDYIISEFLEFNEVIKEALAFARADGETLLVVTADHETGGFAIQKESTMDSIAGAFTSDYHTGTMIPVFAYGPGSELFSGIYENTDIYHKMREAFGWSASGSSGQ